MKSLRLLSLIFIFLFASILFISCSSDDGNPADPGDNNNPDDPQGQEHQLPEIGVQNVEIPEAVTTAANNGNLGATQAQTVLEMVNSIEGYYETFNFDGSLAKSRGLSAINGWTQSWQVQDLTVTLEYDDGWGDIIFLNMYYDGTDGMYTYNHWLRGYFSTSLDPEYFAGTLQLYDYATSTPIIYFKWADDELIGKYIDADIMGIFKIRYVYQMLGEDPGTSGFSYNDGTSIWTVDIYPNGHGRWTQYADANFETLISEGTW